MENKSFITLNRTITNHYRDTLNYLETRSTNAAAEPAEAEPNYMVTITEKAIS